MKKEQGLQQLILDLRKKYPDIDGNSKIWGAFSEFIIDLTSYKLGSKEIFILQQVLQSNTNVTHLICKSSEMNHENLANLLPILINHPTLHTIDLSYNNLNNKGMEHIADLLKKNKMLTSLDINYNHISECTENIVEALRDNRSLLHFFIGKKLPGDIYGRNKLGNQGAITIAQALQNNETLQNIGLGYCEIGDKGAQAIAQVLQNNETLQKIDLSHNMITKKGLQSIADALSKNIVLCELIINDNNIDKKNYNSIKEQIEKSLQSNQLNKKKKKNIYKKIDEAWKKEYYEQVFLHYKELEPLCTTKEKNSLEINLKRCEQYKVWKTAQQDYFQKKYEQFRKKCEGLDISYFQDDLQKEIIQYLKICHDCLYEKVCFSIQNNQYQEAINQLNVLLPFFEQYQEEQKIIKKITQCKHYLDYQNAEQVIEQKDYVEAKKILERIQYFFENDTEVTSLIHQKITQCDHNITYKEAIDALNKKQYTTAQEKFNTIAAYFKNDAIGEEIIQHVKICTNYITYHTAKKNIIKGRYEEAKIQLELVQSFFQEKEENTVLQKKLKECYDSIYKQTQNDLKKGLYEEARRQLILIQFFFQDKAENKILQNQLTQIYHAIYRQAEENFIQGNYLEAQRQYLLIKDFFSKKNNADILKKIIQENYNKAQEAFTKGNYPEAKKHFEFINIGFIQNNQGEAIKQKIQQTNQHIAERNTIDGTLLSKNGQYEQAYQVFKQASLLCPDISTYYEKYKNAQNEYEIVKEREEYYVQAMQAHANKDYKKSLTYLKKAHTLHPTSQLEKKIEGTQVEYILAKADTFFDKQQYGIALKEYQKSIRKNDIDFFLEKAQAIIDTKNIDHINSALQFIEAALEIDPTYIPAKKKQYECLIQLTDVQQSNNNYNEALQYLQQAKKIFLTHLNRKRFRFSHKK